MSQNQIINTMVNSQWRWKRILEHNQPFRDPMDHVKLTQHIRIPLKRQNSKCSPVNHTVSY